MREEAGRSGGEKKGLIASIPGCEERDDAEKITGGTEESCRSGALLRELARSGFVSWRLFALLERGDDEGSITRGGTTIGAGG